MNTGPLNTESYLHPTRTAPRPRGRGARRPRQPRYGNDGVTSGPGPVGCAARSPASTRAPTHPTPLASPADFRWRRPLRPTFRARCLQPSPPPAPCLPCRIATISNIVRSSFPKFRRRSALVARRFFRPAPPPFRARSSGTPRKLVTPSPSLRQRFAKASTRQLDFARDRPALLACLAAVGGALISRPPDHYCSGPPVPPVTVSSPNQNTERRQASGQPYRTRSSLSIAVPQVGGWRVYASASNQFKFQTDSLWYRGQ
ncbi:hypothetical protein THAOC_14800 [Thalassiosira oceanica]|uniref:Uncharacterized protein n=1 Tax=Thalassiosira oceanica TaxID=159749 RepID=K0T1V0_THAOC|nr:hypothetical protein THAOC_14800 [Thalassiosira oceanica]|eukprot:EJK64462.1 hypothetical protein THAOC_14800 [Thalassiosira oceanica]